MKLGQKAIESLAKWGAFTDDRRSLVVENDKVSITGEVTAADNLSCSLAELRVKPRRAAQLSTEQLRAWGDRVAKRVRYLLEAIESVELDAPKGQLLLRSTPPEKKPDGTVFYYEVLLESGAELHLTRQRFDAQHRTRTAEPLHCTRELLEKLVNDLAATAP
jgi:hypothetical protein